MAERVPRSASVLLPVYQGAQFLERVLDALAAQRTSASWDFLAVDCGSTDGTLEILERHARRFPVPLRVEALGRERFDHGDTRNLLAALSSGEILVYLSDDAIPAGPEWLETLLSNFTRPEVGAAYCRNVPRPDAAPLARVASAADPNYAVERRVQRLPDRRTFLGLEPEELRALFAMNDTASALRRELWERHPYPRNNAGEDVLQAKALIEAGYSVVYDERATVLHSHDWPADRVHARALLDGEFQVEWLGRVCIASDEEAARQAETVAARDRAALDSLGCAGEELERESRRALELRQALYSGLRRGGASPRRRTPTAMLDDPFPPVLLVARVGDERAERLASSLCGAGPEARRAVTLARCEAGRWLLEGQPAEVQSALPLGAEPTIVHVFDERGELDTSQWPEVLLSTPAIVERDGGWLVLPLGARSLPRGAPAAELKQDPGAWIGYRTAPAGRRDAPDRAFDSANWWPRYRGLACRAGPVGFDRWGREAHSVEGEVARQGAVGLLVGPKPASIAFELGELPRGAWEAELHLKLYGIESGVRMAGRLLADGREFLRIGPLIPAGRDEIVVLRARLPEAGARRIEIDNQGGEQRHLRVQRLVLRRADVETPCERAWVRRGEARMRGALADLDVPAPPAVPTADLPLVAAIVPTLLGRPLLERSLAALVQSRYPADRLRIVVVDNGSPGDTARWLRAAHPRAEIVRNETNLGFTRASNQGAAAAAGAAVLAFFNDDVVVEPECLLALVHPIAARTCAATAARMLDADTDAPQFLGGGASLQGIALSAGLREEDGPPRRRRALFPCGGAMAIDARVFHGVGGFDAEMFAYYDDLDLGWRLWLAGHEVHTAPDALCRHARSSTSRRFAPEKLRLLQTRNALLCCIKNYDEANLARLLPVLLALHVQRARVMAGRIDERPFRIEYVPSGPLKRFSTWLRRALAPETVPIARMAMADLLALDDVLGRLPHWLDRRADVQALRRRPDAEILPLFLDPLRCHEGEARYVELQQTLIERFGLAQIFGAEEPRR